MTKREDHLVCKQCLELFKEPVILNCGHSICFHCAKEQYQFEMQKREGSENNERADTVAIKCSTCSSSHAVNVVEGIDSLQRNRDLQEAVKILSKPACDNDCSKPATVYCSNCSGAKFCNECFEKIHQSAPFLKSHVSQPLCAATTEKFCTLHGEKLSIYCQTCKQQLCYLCLASVTSKHKTHNYMALKEYEQRLAQEMQQHKTQVEAMEKCLTEFVKVTEGNIEQVTQNLQNIKREIELEFDSLVEALVGRKRELLKQVSKIEETQVEGLIAQRGSLQQLTEAARNLMTQQVSQANSSVMTSQFATLRSYVLLAMMSSQTAPCTKLVLSTNEPRRIIESLGSVIVYSMIPSKMDRPVVTTQGEYDVMLEWKPFPADIGIKYEYTLEVSTDNTKTWKKAYVGSESRFHYTQADRKVYRLYFRVFARTELHEGEKSEVTEVSFLTPFVQTFEYSGSDYDQKGVLYWLGTSKGKNTSWTNPVRNGSVTVSASSIKYGSLEEITKHGVGCFYTKCIPDSWVQITLNDAIKLCLSHYTLGYFSKAKGEVIRNWVIEGSNDGIFWFVIQKYLNDQSLQEAKESHTFAVQNSDYYSMFRIRTTGMNSSNSYHLLISGVELYGTVICD